MRILLILIISFSVSATTLDKVNATRLQMNRYIIPQMRSILKDFAHLENAIVESHKNFKNIEKGLSQIRDGLQQKKYAKNSKIMDQINKNMGDLLIIKNNKDIDKLYHKVTSLKSTEMYLSNCVSFNEDCIDIARIEYIDEIEKVLAYINTTRYSTFPKPLKKEFKVVWNEFIKRIKTLRSDRSKLQNLDKILVKLNYSWHEFNAFMTIRKEKTDKNVMKYVKYIDNRWRSILKTAL